MTRTNSPALSLMQPTTQWHRLQARSPLPPLIAASALAIATACASAETPAPVSQQALNALNATDQQAAFAAAFEAGDELTEALFTSARGVGANVEAGRRFSRLPRADLVGAGEWAQHQPAREGGPHAQACITCHAAPYANGAGGVALNVAIDPGHSSEPRHYLERNTAHLFGLGAPQRLAEEMTVELRDIEQRLGERVCAQRTAATAELLTKGVRFGTLKASPSAGSDACRPVFDRTAIEGVSSDLVIRPFGWKGTHTTIRAFSRDAAHNELGMQADELVGDIDGDHDGVSNELSIGDLTAISVYIAALERPVSRLELDTHGVLALTIGKRADIEAGRSHFDAIGCSGCHVPEMPLNDPLFSEPSRTEPYFDTTLPSGATPASVGLSAATAIRFDLTDDQPNNRLSVASGEINFGAFARNQQGQAVIRWFSDFKRHDMGPALADPVDAYGFGASTWPTRSLAGVGSTGPWLHDGRATTLAEAVLAHGGEAAASTDRFIDLTAAAQAQLIAFLDNLVIIDLDADELVAQGH